tara:strand:+ start:1087 stop:1263 length:177 start_codon:yes stop_codon:yes gene_type:complete
MGLKMTHFFIIAMSILLTGFFSYQMLIEETFLYSIGGALLTLGLIYYMTVIIKKFKTI